MTGVWFTQGVDAPMVEVSVRAFRETFPGGRVFIFCEGGKDFSEAWLGRVSPDFYEVTWWERRKNLNGREAVLGVLDGLARAARMTGEVGALKVDADALVLGGNWVDERKALCGFDLKTFRFAAGACYWIDEGAAEVIAAGIRGRQGDNVRDAWHVGEDRWISAEAVWHFGARQVALEERSGVTWDFPNPDVKAALLAEMVVFQDRRRLFVPGDRKEIECGRVMGAFFELWKSQ